MRGSRWLCGLGGLLTGMGLLALPVRAADNALVSSTREQVTLTIYDQNFALVSEQRPLTLKQGLNEVTLLEVSPLLDTQSLLLQWLGRPSPMPEIVAHTYDLGIQNSSSLLQRYVGKRVQVVRYGQDGRPAGVLEGILLSAEGGQLVLEATETSFVAALAPDLLQRALYVNPEGTLRLPMEPGTPLLPALCLQIHAPADSNATLTLSYLTGGLDWDADYIAILRGENALRLECWATVTNQTGLAFREARVNLATGVAAPLTVQTAQRLGRREEERMMEGYAFRAVPRGRYIEAQPLGEVYSYPIRRTVSIDDARQSRLLLHEAGQVPVQKRYLYRAPTLWADSAPYIGKEVRRNSAEVSLVLENRKEHGLGIPLPSGSVRLYETDAQGVPRYLGTAQLPATPVNQKITLTVGQAFDITGEWQPLRQTARGRGRVEYEV